MKSIKSLILFFFVLALSYFSISHLLLPGFFPIHDNTQVERVSQMTKSLQEGMFPVRWVSDLGYGYGYPIFNYYAPLSYYFGSFLNLTGVNALLSTKIMMIVGVLLSGISMFFLGKSIWGNWGGLISSLFYVYAPYHAINIYVRGDVSEYWAYAFIPFVFYSLIKLLREYNWKYVVFGSVSFAAVITSHNLTAFIMFPIIVAYIVFNYLLSRNKKFLYYSFLIVFFGMTLSAFYSVPAIFEMNYTNVFSLKEGTNDFRQHFVCLNQLWESPWGFGGSASGCIDGLSFKLGKFHILASVFSILVLVLTSLRFFENKFGKIKLEKAKAGFFAFSSVGLIFSVFMMLDISRPLWEILPYIDFLQYPWRFLGVSSLFMSVLIGFLIYVIQAVLKKINKEKLIFIFSSIVIFVLILISTKLFVPQTILYKNEKDFINLDHIRWETSRISDEYMPPKLIRPASYIEISREKFVSNKDINVIYQTSKISEFHATVVVNKDLRLNIHSAFFPGWEAYVDNKKVELIETNKGVAVSIGKGQHSVDLFLSETPLEKFANSISLASLFLLAAGIILSRKRNIHE